MLKTIDFVIFTSCKLNIELNEQISMKTYCSVWFTELVVTCHGLYLRRNFFLGG